MRTRIVRTTLALALALGCAATTAVAQETGTITGSVTDIEAGQPLDGAQITIVGTQDGMIANDQGRYLLTGVPVGEVTLRVQHIGYALAEQTVTVAAGQSVVADFRLQPQAVRLDELVVTGYGQQRREDLTGAVSSVSADQFIQAPARDAASLVVGKIAGLTVTTPSGDPRSNSQINLRGIPSFSGGEPFVIVDGVPGDLETVAPQDIASIDVLKDGSAAAIYGSRASGGVVIISTKKYQAGTPPTIRYDGYANVQTINNRPDFLGAGDYRRLIAEDEAAGRTPRFVDWGTQTDWQNLLLRDPVSHTHNLTITGGAQNTNYTASLGFRERQGIFERSDQEELTGRVNVGHTMFDGRLQADVNLLTRIESSQEGINYDYAWRQVLIRNPTDSIFRPDGSYVERGTYFYPNPAGMIAEYDGDEEERDLRLHGMLTLRPTDALAFSLLAGTEKTSNLNGDFNTQRAVTSGLSQFLYANRRTESEEDRTLELTGTYAGAFQDHYVTLLGGYSYQDVVEEGFSAGNRDFPTDLFGYNALETGDGLTQGLAGLNSGKSSYKVIGFFGRLNYDWQNRFLLMGSVRYEGNSRFGADHKWGLFPGVSAGWRLSEESFMDGAPFDDLKLRAGFGVTGIAPQNSYLSLTSYGFGGRFPFNGTWVQGISPERNPNPDLRWERKEELNVGLDFSVFDYRLSGSVDLYRRDTKDMLYNYDVPSPPFLDDNLLANVGHMRNSGVEADLTYDLIRRAGLRWQVNANWSYNRNELVSLSNEVFEAEECFNSGFTGEPIQTSTHRVCVGGPIGDFYGYQSVGVDEETGRWIVLDTLGNEISIDDAGDQRHVLGNGIPDHYAALNTTLQLGSWDLNVNMRGAFGHQILNFQRMFYENPNNTEYNMLQSALEPVYDTRMLDNELQFVSYYIEDGDYWKIDNVTLGYTFGAGPLEGVLNNARVYVSGRNLLTLTGYQGMDPEVSQRPLLSPGNDNRDKYPTTRTFTTGVSITF